MKPFWALLVSRFEDIEAELNALDAATGDGDHGTTMLKGLRAAVESESPGKAFRMAAGGASGMLFAEVISALDASIRGAMPLQDALTRAASRIGMFGQARPGDKTMLDSLLPASGSAPGLHAIARAAWEGYEATRKMAARKGRARYVEGAGMGHLDAGARSVAEILQTYAEWVGEEDEEADQR